ncbi:MAG: hypothetical protein NVSMB30_14070 [Hymenobacter sp.]
MAAGHDQVQVWGTGEPRREFLHVDDLADACLHLLLHYDGAAPVNVGTGEDLTIRELASLIARLVGFRGRTVFDPTRPDGTLRKVLDISQLRNLGWEPRIGLEAGLRAVLASAEWRAVAVAAVPVGAPAA